MPSFLLSQSRGSSPLCGHPHYIPEHSETCPRATGLSRGRVRISTPVLSSRNSLPLATCLGLLSPGCPGRGGKMDGSSWRVSEGARSSEIVSEVLA